MALSLGKNSPVFHILRHICLPLFLVFVCPIFVAVLVLFPLPGGVEANFKSSVILGDAFSWIAVSAFTLWCLATLKITDKIYKGPITTFGLTPVYVDNGFQFFCATVALFAVANFISPKVSVSVYDHMPQILGTLNVIALVLCAYLWFQGRRKTQDPVLRQRLPVIFEFYRGMELHPRLFGVDVKQLINCRIGLGLWTLLTLAFLVTSYTRNGFSSGILVNVLLQTIYLAKFYWWETGYFTTLDITMDRAGFYLSWGCLNFVPSFYTFSSYYLVNHPSVLSDDTNYLIFVLGLLSILLNYEVDREKQLFIETKGKCKVWFKRTKAIEGNYKTRPVRLMVSGFWGVARHVNYVFELLLALFWNLPCYGLGIYPFMYNIVLFILLVHRIYRDESKCQDKYGPYWKQYCKMVRYRMIPYIY